MAHRKYSRGGSTACIDDAFSEHVVTFDFMSTCSENEYGACNVPILCLRRKVYQGGQHPCSSIEAFRTLDVS